MVKAKVDMTSMHMGEDHSTVIISPMLLLFLLFVISAMSRVLKKLENYGFREFLRFLGTGKIFVTSLQEMRVE